MSELLLSLKERQRRMKWKLYAKVQRPEKRASFWDERLSCLLESKWPVAESQRGMTQDEIIFFAWVQRFEDWASFSEEGLSFLPEVEIAVAES